MANIFDAGTKIVESWINDIKQKNINGVVPQSIFVPSKLIVFAWTYATYQTYELKNRLGSSIKFIECLESIFVNKLAQIALAIYYGYNDDDILKGKTFVSLDYSSKDERFFVDMQAYAHNKLINVSGTKKFAYPIANKHPNDGQLIIYIDGVRLVAQNRSIARLNIKDGMIKATILGYATKTDLKLNQDQSKFMGYSNMHTAFTGFDILKSVDDVTVTKKQYQVPEYVTELVCYDNIEQKLENIMNSIKASTETKPIVKIDYKSLFDGFI
jgi:hypothetical protein